VILALALFSTSARALRSADLLAPLVSGPNARLEDTNVQR